MTEPTHQTANDREAAAAEFEALMVAQGMPSGAVEEEAVAAPKPAGEAEPSEVAEERTSEVDGEVDVEDVTNQLAEALDADKEVVAADRDWKGKAKGELIKAGHSEAEAHYLAYKGSKETVEKLLGKADSAVPSGDATPDTAPTGTADQGLQLSPALLEALEDLDGQAAEELGTFLSKVKAEQSGQLGELSAQVAALQHRLREQDVSSTRQELSDARESYSGSYPELHDPSVWSSLSPLINAAHKSGLADSVAEAVKIATVKLLGDRNHQPDSNKVHSSTATTQPVNRTAGRQVTAEDRRDAIASAIFHGRSSEDVMRMAKR